MIYIIIILLINSVYFATRFFLLSKNIKKSTFDLKYINKNINSNSKLKLGYPDKNFEILLIEINKYLEVSQIEKIKYVNREKDIKKEIENISHDLRTPLTSILGYLEFLKDIDKTENEYKEYLYIIEKKSRRLQHLIQDFYDLSSLDEKEYRLNIEEVDINKILLEQLLLYYNEFDKNNITVDLQLSQNPINIKADKNALDRIFMNLIQNATKYSKSDFKVYLQEQSNKVIIIFKNDIEDLDIDEIDKLFERFYMKDKSRSNKGSGLGLTITKLLVENMEGEIESKIKDNYIEFVIKFNKVI